MAYDSLFNGGEMEGSGAMEVSKFYGAVILVAGSFLFGLKSIRHRLYAEVGYFNIVSIKIAAVLGGYPACRWYAYILCGVLMCYWLIFSLP